LTSWGWFGLGFRARAQNAACIAANEYDTINGENIQNLWVNAVDWPQLYTGGDSRLKGTSGLQEFGEWMFVVVESLHTFYGADHF
jgi:hypothetical protein